MPENSFLSKSAGFPAWCLLPRLCVPLLLAALALVLGLPLFAQDLVIHEINVGWGSCTYIKAPNGKTLLLDGGNTGMGTAQVKPYLASISAPAFIDVVIGSHQHCDHIGGLDEVIGAGYTAGIQYYSGSTYSTSCSTGWLATTPTPIRMPVNTVITLGTNCTLRCLGNWDQSAGNYEVCDGTRISGVSDENDKSIALLISCDGFDYLWAGDLGGGNTDQFCIPDRSTTQADLETYVINAAISMGYVASGGIDVLHINHHGSESSTNMNYKNSGMPEYAICATGRGQSSGWALPRKVPLDDVLLGVATSCINPPATIKIFQTEEGDAPTVDQSYSGYCVGDIVVTFDPSTGYYCIDADGAVDYGPNEYATSGLPICQQSDGTTCTSPSAPVISTVTDKDPLVLNGVIVTFTTGTPATQHYLWMDGSQVATAITSPYTYQPGNNGSHSYVVRAVNGTCHTDSNAVVAVDAYSGGCTTPAQEVIETANTDKSGFKWANIPGADNYRVLRGIQSDLPALITSSTDFSCYSYGIASGATGVTITTDDPSGEAGRCYYYLIQGYGCTDPSAYLGPIGDATAGQRTINLSGSCVPACAAVSASIDSVAPSTTATLGTQQTFNGSGSGEGTLTYAWDFHYNGTFNQEATGQTANYTYASTGSYQVALKVTDSCSNPSPQSAISTVAITINSASSCGPLPVISQVYGGGGNSGAYYKNDFIELFNRGDQAQSLSGWSVQYASATGTTWQVTTLSGSIPAGGYYLVQEAQGSGGTASLPTPDATGSINMSASNGKVALVNGTTALSGSCPSTGIVDMVGYGTANCYEGSAAPGLTNTTSDSRASAGCTDTGSNASDFAATTSNASNPARNSATATHTCTCP